MGFFAIRGCTCCYSSWSLRSSFNTLKVRIRIAVRQLSSPGSRRLKKKQWDYLRKLLPHYCYITITILQSIGFNQFKFNEFPLNRICWESLILITYAIGRSPNNPHQYLRRRNRIESDILFENAKLKEIALSLKNLSLK